MASTSRFPRDPGLSARMGLTLFMIGLLYVVFIAVLVALSVRLVDVLILAAVLLVAQYWFSDRMALFAMGGREVSPQQAPELHAVVDRLCALADMPKPRVALADVDLPNAFATGRNPKAAVVCVTTGLLRRLDEPELEAVLSHELSHVAHRDVAVMTVASFLGVAAGLLTRFVLYAGMFGGFGGGRGGRSGGNGGNGNDNLVVMELGIVAVSALVYGISFLLTRALSRYRELSADRSGALLIGRPSLLASALVKVSGEIGRIPTRDLRSARAFNAFYFAPALTQGRSVAGLLSTHPSLERRLEQLRRLEAELGRPA
ncbi:MAG: zinc metalloprotease HtpX [Acidimicrobiales bacterium]